MDKLSDSSLEPTKVVFTTVKSVDSQSFSLKGGAFLKVGAGTEENLNRNMSYEVTF